MPKLLSFPANRMDVGLNLQSIRNLKLGEISSGASARYERGSAIYTGPGFRTASDLGSSASVGALREGTVFPLLWAKSGTKVYYMVDPDSGTSYDTGVTVTTTEQGDFHEQGNGDFYYINQTDTPFRFAVAQNTVAILDSDVTITVGADWISKFSTTNPSTIYIRGDAITYTGVNATQLTGVTGIQAGGHPISSYITQSSNPSTFPSTYNGTFMFDLDSRLYTGGRLHFEGNLYGSAPEDISNPQYFYDFQGNGAISKVFSGKLTGGIKGTGRAYIFTQNQCFQFTGIDIPTGGLLIQPISQQYGAYNPRCIVDMEGTIAFFGKKRLIPIEIDLAPGSVSAPALNVNFDSNLRPWLSSLDDDDQQADAKLHYDKTNQILKIQARRNGVLETYFFDRSNGNFGPSEVRSAKCFSMFNSNSYFGHVSNGKVYRDDYGRTNDGLPIYHAWATGEIEDDKGRRYMQAYSVKYTGTMSIGSEHYFKVYLDGSTTASYSQLFTDSLITSTTGISLGSNLIAADGSIGGSQDTPLVYLFKNEVLLIGISGESFRLEWVTIKEGVYFKVSDFSLDVYDMNQGIRTRN